MELSSKHPVLSRLHGKKVLVTGGAGFIGSNLVEHILQNFDTRVRVLDDFSTGTPVNLDDHVDDPRFELVEGDVCDLQTCVDAVQGCDIIIHLAALGSVPRSVDNPIRTHQVNTDGFLNMLVAARDHPGRCRFVYASSSSVYGDDGELPKVEGREGRLMSPYAITKHVGEQYARVFSELYGFHSIGLRFFNIFGARQRTDSAYAAVIPRFCKAFAEGTPPVIYGEASISRDFTHVDNAIYACELAGSIPMLDRHVAMNIACGRQISLGQVVEELRHLSGRQLSATFALPRPGDLPHSMADLGTANEVIDYKPLVMFEEGLKKTYDWYLRSTIL